MKLFSTNRVLISVLALAILTILLVEFVLDDIPELFSGGAKIGTLFVNIGLSYIAAYIFYIVTFVLPKRIERKHVEEHAAHLIEKVMFYILFVMQDSTNFNISQKDLKLSYLNENDFREAMTNVYLDSQLKQLRIGEDGRNMTVGRAVEINIENMKKTVDELLKYSSFIEAELIAAISASVRVVMNESWVNTLRLGPIFLGYQVLRPGRSDISHYAKYVFEYLELYKQIEKILLIRYPKTVAAKKYADNINNLKEANK